jgi:hypothetical protein
MERRSWQRFACVVAAALVMGSGASCSGTNAIGILPDGSATDEGGAPRGEASATDASHRDGAKGGDSSTGPCSGADACGAGTGCKSATDCKSLVCKAGVCEAPSPSDGVKNDSETDVDCGGSSSPSTDGAPACANGKACTVGSDCTSTSCQAGKCVPPTCTDHIKDGMETDVDCGGPTCAACPTSDKCSVATDCQSLVCTGGVCIAPTDTDTVKNDSETDVDCGGGLLADGQPNPSTDGAPACAIGKTCSIGSDCVESVCAVSPLSSDAGVDAATSDGGTPVPTCQPPTDSDGAKNDSETDVDCGGALLADGSANPASDGAPACGAAKGCALASDCQSDVCTGGLCQTPSATDGVKNDSETDIDCGGGTLASGASNPASDGALACEDGKDCVLGTDCKDLVCANGAVTTPSADGSPINCPAGQSCTCQPPTPTDGVENDSETDIDCGGDFVAGGASNTSSDLAPTCAVTKKCSLGTDCVQGVCNSTAGAGAGPADCPAGDGCTCQAASPTDGVKNDSETDIDCGGGFVASGAKNASSDGAPVCAVGKGCVFGTDCAAGVCNSTAGAGLGPINCPAGDTCTCQAAAPGDGVKNDSETDVDCGGSSSGTSDGAHGCADDLNCKVDADCLSTYCSLLTGKCVAAQSCKGLVTPAAIMNLVTCPGGLGCPAGTVCNTDTYRCVLKTSPVTPDPGTAYHDAYGTPNALAAGQHAGIDTCGTGEATDPIASQNHESCCRSLLLPGSTTVRLDKYEVTAGRMRQFVEAVAAQMLADHVHNPDGYAYDLRDWALGQIAANNATGQTLSAQIPAAAIQLLPQTYYNALNIEEATGGTTMDASYPSDLQGCYTADGAAGASTYWWQYSDANGVGLDQVGSPPKPYTQDYYDIKAMNCAPSYMYAAFCAWDGGFLPTQAQVAGAYGIGQYPWTTATGASAPFLPNPYPVTAALFPNISSFLDTVNWDNDSWGGKPGNFYFYPNGGSMAEQPDEISTTGLDYSAYIASPGRFPLDLTRLKSASFGGTEGWQDLGANMMETMASASLTGGDPFCDCAATNGEASNCTCSGTSGTKPGVWRPNATTKYPLSAWEGGSWEGHPTGSPQGTDSGGNLVASQAMFGLANGYNFPIFTQYGKLGVRCARNAEP